MATTKPAPATPQPSIANMSLIDAITMMANAKSPDRPDVAVVREGDKIVLPAQPSPMSYEEGIHWLDKCRIQDQQRVAIYHLFKCIPLDGARAISMAIKSIFGFTELQSTPGFFGDRPPVMISLFTGHNKVEQIPWGRMSFPGINGWVDFAITSEEPSIALTGEVVKKDMPVIDRLVKEAQRFLDTQSIYRGRAIRMDFEYLDRGEPFNPDRDAPKFFDVDTVSPSQLILPAVTAHRVEASIFTPITKREACRARGIPGKRGVLLAGQYGVGKSLTALVTAHLSEKHGTTFLMVRDAHHIAEAIKIARLYQPAVVFVEDIDRVTEGQRDAAMDQILNTIDGVDSKNSDIMVVLTTNHLEKINSAMLRPGRIDDVIVVQPPDAAAAIALVKRYGGEALKQGEDYTEVGRVLAGKIPAVIREIAERSKLAALSRMPSPGVPTSGEVCAVDLLIAAEAMADHEKLINKPKERTPGDLERACEVIAVRLRNALIASGHAIGVQEGEIAPYDIF